jgi:hypothetical protein
MSKGYRDLYLRHPLTGERVRIQEHVLIWLLKEGLWQKGIVNAGEGNHIHHIDCDPHNNDPCNLICISNAEHQRIHWNLDEERRKKSLDNLNKYRESRTPEAKKANVLKAQAASVDRMRRLGPTKAQLEGLKKARAARVFRSGPPKELNAEEISEIKSLYPNARGKYNQAKALRDRFGISRGRLQRIANS